MKVSLALKEWKYVSDKTKGNRINGKYSVNTGAIEISETEFNADYGGTTIVFSNELMLEIDKLTEQIGNEIKENFFGKDGE